VILDIRVRVIVQPVKIKEFFGKLVDLLDQFNFAVVDEEVSEVTSGSGPIRMKGHGNHIVDLWVESRLGVELKKVWGER
jgi:hypothetical protein